MALFRPSRNHPPDNGGLYKGKTPGGAARRMDGLRNLTNALRRIDPGLATLLGLFVFLVWLLVAFDVYRPMFRRVHANDPVGYYAWTHSLLFDRDLHFENEYRRLNPGAPPHAAGWADPDAVCTPTGHLPNYFAMGAGLLWIPFVMAVHPMASYLGGRQDGFSQPYHIAVFFAVTFYGLAGAILLYYAMRAWFDKTISAAAAIGAWTASPALFYTFPDVAMAHSCSFFSMALFFFVWMRFREHAGMGKWFLIGMTLGLAALARWQNAAFALIPAVDLLAGNKRAGALRLLACAAGAALAFLPQMLAWQMLYGHFLTIPQGPDFIHWTQPDFAALLFSRAYGLLSWTPLCGIAGLGLLAAPRKHRRAYAALGAALLAQLYINACIHEAGWSFGMRRMVNCTPIFAAGLAALLLRLKQRRAAGICVIALFGIWNILFILQYGGLLDNLYIGRALTALAEHHEMRVEDLTHCETLPDGTPFHYGEFVYTHCFPRQDGPTWRQMYMDKALLIRVIAHHIAGYPPPT